MKLIYIENFELKVAPEALLIRPIRKLWNQDRSDKKEKFYQQMSYMFYLVDPRSTLSYILDVEERAKEIIKQEGLPKNFKPSPLLEEAMEIYKKHTITVSQKLLESSLIGANKVSDFLRDVNLSEEDGKGRPKYQVSTITAALKNVEGIVQSIQTLQIKVNQELIDSGKARGSQELTIGDMDY